MAFLVRNRNKLWLVVVPLQVLSLDVALTLLGQGRGYWAGNYHLANEASPPGYWLLSRHPLAFIAAMAIWTSLLCLAMLALPTILTRIASQALTIAHAWGAASWLRGRGNLEYWSQIALFILVAAAAVLSWEQYERRTRKESGEKTKEGGTR
jgi:hypothetical protein